MKCPYCNRDRNDQEPIRLAKLILGKNKFFENINPGGRTLFFKRGNLHLHDMCNWCDYEKIKEFLK